MKIALCVLLLCYVQASAKDLTPGRLVPLFADLDVSETSHVLSNVLQGIETCGDRFVWRYRHELRNATAHAGPLILVATGGPNEEEQASSHFHYSEGWEAVGSQYTDVAAPT